MRLLVVEDNRDIPANLADYHYIEGAAPVPGFGLVVCVDRSPGVLLVFSSIKDWPSLHHAPAY